MITNRLHFVQEDGACSMRERKKQLRTYMKEKRGENENRDVKERNLLGNFLQADDMLFGDRTGACIRRTYFVYLSFSSEARTDELIETLVARGDKVYCPRVENGEMVAVLYGEDFTLSDRGIREPVGSAYEGAIDVAITPFLAVDKQGRRLGYGGGYYDRWFQRHGEAKRIAYGFDMQVVDSVPSEDFDERVDMVVTDKQVFYTERKNG